MREPTSVKPLEEKGDSLDSFDESLLVPMGLEENIEEILASIGKKKGNTQLEQAIQQGEHDMPEEKRKIRAKARARLKEMSDEALLLEEFYSAVANAKGLPEVCAYLQGRYSVPDGKTLINSANRKKFEAEIGLLNAAVAYHESVQQEAPDTEAKKRKYEKSKAEYIATLGPNDPLHPESRITVRKQYKQEKPFRVAGWGILGVILIAIALSMSGVLPLVLFLSACGAGLLIKATLQLMSSPVPSFLEVLDVAIGLQKDPEIKTRLAADLAVAQEVAVDLAQQNSGVNTAGLLQRQQDRPPAYASGQAVETNDSPAKKISTSQSSPAATPVTLIQMARAQIKAERAQQAQAAATDCPPSASPAP